MVNDFNRNGQVWMWDKRDSFLFLSTRLHHDDADVDNVIFTHCIMDLQTGRTLHYDEGGGTPLEDAGFPDVVRVA